MALINKKQIPPTVSFKDSMEAVTSGMTEKQFKEKYNKEINYLSKNIDKLTNEELDRLGDLQAIRRDKTLAAENSDKENYLSSSQNKNVTSTDDGYLMPWLMAIGTGAGIGYGGSKLILPDGSYTLPRTDGWMDHHMNKMATRFGGLKSFKGHQSRIASDLAKSVANQYSNSFAESGKPKSITPEQFRETVKNVKAGVETKLQAETGGMKDTYLKSERAVKNAFKKNKIAIQPTSQQPPSTPSKTVNVDIKQPTQLPPGKKLLQLPASTYKPNWVSGTRNLGIVPQNVSKLMNMRKPNLRGGVGALAAFALNDQLREFAENPDRSFGENVRSGLENTALGVISPSNYIGGARAIFNAMSEVSDKLPMGKGELLSKGLRAIGGGLEKAGNWTYEKERDIFDPVGQEYYRRRREADKGYGVISQTKSDFKKEFRGEKESPLGSAVTGMDLFNVGTKGMSTKKGVESFDNMLVELGYNPNELTTKQKVSMMKRGKGLIQKK